MCRAVIVNNVSSCSVYLNRNQKYINIFSILRQFAYEMQEHMSEKGWFLFTLLQEAAFKGASLTAFTLSAHISHLCTDMRVCRTHMLTHTLHFRLVLLDEEDLGVSYNTFYQQSFQQQRK